VHRIANNWADLKKIWHQHFYNDPHVDPSKHSVRLTEAPLNPQAHRKQMITLIIEIYIHCIAVDVPANDHHEGTSQ
jgi:actin-related protein